MRFTSADHRGVAGKDIGHVVVIQTFAGLADDGAINQSIVEGDAMTALRTQERGPLPAYLFPHDFYEVFEV